MEKRLKSVVNAMRGITRSRETSFQTQTKLPQFILCETAVKLCMAIANGRTCHNTNTYYAKRLARSRTGSISPSSTLTWLSLKAGLTGGKTRRNTLPGYLNCVKLGIFGMGRHHPYIFKAKLTCFGSNVAMYNVSSSLQE